ncbi:MAG: sigma-54 dependent transcriptional regulator [Desulfobulbus sp.]|nr:sigma-54 dependent transcriptional regulator [Desulfobulbus sp.]
MDRYTILIVDDDRLLQNALNNILGEQYHTLIAGSGEEALALIENKTVDLVLLDIRLPGMDGMETLEAIKACEQDLLVIMMTAYEDIQTVITSMRQGAYDYLVKPLEMEVLELVVTKALETVWLKKEVEKLRHGYLSQFHIEEVVAESEEIQAVFDFAAKVAKSDDTTVLIEGQSGVGKEVVARTIHHRSSRFDKSFIGINCGAINKELLESELFGYGKGAFTGGLPEGKQGKIELADGGTLLLDEIGELLPEAQVKLLRFLEEREFYPVGDSRKIKVDVRIIAATNKSLETLVQAGSFREDLYYRLNVARVTVPPLAQRRADIIPLALVFMHQFNQKFAKNFRRFDLQARNMLIEHSWRGNIRELKNAVERVVLMEDGDTILPEHLAFLGVVLHAPLPRNTQSIRIPPEGLDLEKLNRDLIIQALELSGGNKSKAAKLLAISRPTLIYRIEKHGLST